MKPTNIEVEAKLIARDAAALRRLPSALRRLCVSVKPMGLRLIRDCYYDTPGWKLRRAGYACRIRRVRGAATLALKSLRRPRGGVSVREEFEQALAERAKKRVRHLFERERQPDPFFGTGPVGGKVRTIIGRGPLRPVFHIRNRRRVFEVLCAGGLRAEVCADSFTVSAGKSARRLAEVELEVIRGDRTQLRRLAFLLAKEMRLAAGARTKYRQGLEVAGMEE